nr:Chain I, HIRUDIN I [Hirudo medicinalis]
NEDFEEIPEEYL